MWVVEYLDDVASDLSVFHRVDDMLSLPGPRFCLLVSRLPFYDGVMRARAMALAAEEDPQARAPAAQHMTGPRSGTYTPDVVTPAGVARDPLLASLISFGNPAAG